MLIRVEKATDREAIYAINTSAFPTPDEANIVDALRDQAQPFISLVAEDSEGEVVGHIMFSPVTLVGSPNLKIMGLAPMAVSPEHQHKGIGSALIKAGLKKCKQLGINVVVVLGHPDYYPRFGFLPTAQFGIKGQYDVPEDVFMAIELIPDALNGKTGIVKYHSAFSSL